MRAARLSPLLQAQRQRQRKLCSRRQSTALVLAVVGAAALLLGANPAAAQAAAAAAGTYPIDWAAVPDTPPTTKDLQATCTCKALTAACTPNCCCDPDCPAAAVTAARASGTCLPEGPQPPLLDYCAPSDQFARVNLPDRGFYRIQKRTAGEDLLTQLLCVATDNNPSLGATYPDPPVGASVAANAALAQCSAPAAAPVPKTAYAPGDPIVAAVPLPTGATVKGPLAVPVPGVTAACDDLGQVGFLERIPTSLKEETSTCWRPLPAGPAFRSLCLDSSSVLSPLRLARTLLFPTPATAATGAVNATIASVATTDPTTGLPGAPGPGPAAAPTYVPATAISPAICRGAVVRADWAVRYAMDAAGGGGRVASAAVDVTVGDVQEDAGGFRQAASVLWADATAPAAAGVALSGAPGYQEGFPVLAGTRVAAGTKAAVSRLRAGLALPAAGPGGSCDPARAAPVGFGYNATSACARRMTPAQLAAFCAAGDAAAAVRAAGAAPLLDAAAAGAALLGVWGSSDAANVNEWVPVALSGWPPPAPVWSAADQRCDGVVTGFEIKLVTGVAFSTANVQRKLLHAELCFTTGSWAADAATAAASPTAAQAFALRFSASFRALDQGRPAAALRPAPPLVVPLPPDLFYPFL